MINLLSSASLSFAQVAIQKTFNLAVLRGAPLPVLRKLISLGANVDAVDDNLDALIHIAARKCDVDMLARLAALGADPDNIYAQRYTPIFIAWSSPNTFAQILAFISELLKMRPNLQILSPPAHLTYGTNPHVLGPSLSILDVIIRDVFAKEVNHLLQYVFETTPLLDMQYKFAQGMAYFLPRIVQQLIEYDKDLVNRAHFDELWGKHVTSLVTILHPAYLAEEPIRLIMEDLKHKLVVLFLENGADPNFRSGTESLLHFAMQNQNTNLKIVHALLDYGANPNLCWEYPFLPNKMSHRTSLNAALNSMLVELRVEEEPRHDEWIQIIDKFLEKGADLNLNTHTQSSLQLALQVDHDLFLKFLKHGADTRFVDPDFGSAFATAIKMRNFEAAKICLDHDIFVSLNKLNYGTLNARTLQAHIYLNVLTTLAYSSLRYLNGDIIYTILDMLWGEYIPQETQLDQRKWPKASNNFFTPIMDRIRRDIKEKLKFSKKEENDPKKREAVQEINQAIANLGTPVVFTLRGPSPSTI